MAYGIRRARRYTSPLGSDADADRKSVSVTLVIVHRSCGHGDGVLALALFKPMVDLAHDFETIGLLATSRS